MSATKKTVHFAEDINAPVGAQPAPADHSTPQSIIWTCEQGSSPSNPFLNLGCQLNPSIMGAPYHLKQSPPFRTGGRGSKQVSKAIEHSIVEKTNAGASPEPENTWVVHFGSPMYFAKVVSTSNKDPNSILLQKMQPGHVDSSLLVPWEGHLCIAKPDSLQQIQMKKEPGGWRLLETPTLSKLIADLREKSSPSIGGATPSAPVSKKRSYDDWDYVSLESSEFDECSSKTSSLFQLLSPNGGNPKHPIGGAGRCAPPLNPGGESIPLRQKMQLGLISASDNGHGAKSLTSISPAEVKAIGCTPDVVNSTISSMSAPSKMKAWELPSAGESMPPAAARAQSPDHAGSDSADATAKIHGLGERLLSQAGQASSNCPSAGAGDLSAEKVTALYRTPSPRGGARTLAAYKDQCELMSASSARSDISELNAVSIIKSGLMTPQEWNAVTSCEISDFDSVHIPVGPDGSEAADSDGDTSETVSVIQDFGKSSKEEVLSHVSPEDLPIDPDGEDICHVTEQRDDPSAVDHRAVSMELTESDEGAARAEADTNSVRNKNKSNSNDVRAANIPIASTRERPPKPKQDRKRSRSVSQGLEPVLAHSSSSSLVEAPLLPRRRAAAQSSSYANRNSFFGSWPSRKQSAAAGTWNL